MTTFCPFPPQAHTLAGSSARDAVTASVAFRHLRNGLTNMSRILECLRRMLGAQRAAFPPIVVVNHESDGHPYKESNPVHNGQPGHQQQASHDCYDWCDRAARRAESTGTIRFAIAQDQYSGCHQRKGKQSADIRQISEGSDIQKTGRDAHEKSGHPRGKIWSAETWMHTAEDSRQQAIARHCVPHASL